MKVDSSILKLKMLIHGVQLSSIWASIWPKKYMGTMNGQDKLEVGLYKTLILVNLI